MGSTINSSETHRRRIQCIESEGLAGVITSARHIDASILKSSHRTTFSDGDIYRKFRQYQDQNKDGYANDWKERLSKCKQVGLRRLLKRKGFVKGLDDLSCYPPLMDA